MTSPVPNVPSERPWTIPAACNRRTLSRCAAATSGKSVPDAGGGRATPASSSARATSEAACWRDTARPGAYRSSLTPEDQAEVVGAVDGPRVGAASGDVDDGARGVPSGHGPGEACWADAGTIPLVRASAPARMMVIVLRRMRLPFSVRARLVRWPPTVGDRGAGTVETRAPSPRGRRGNLTNPTDGTVGPDDGRTPATLPWPHGTGPRRDVSGRGRMLIARWERPADPIKERCMATRIPAT